MPFTSEQLNRFWIRVNLDGPIHPIHGQCWTWIGSEKSPATFYVHRKQHSAYRVSWMIHYGEIPNDLWVLHKCDNTHCVNPDHLFLGTHSDNMSDMQRKKRARGDVNSPKTYCRRSERATIDLSRGRPRTHNWDEWLKPGTVVLEKGKDFNCETASFRISASRQIYNRNLNAEVLIRGLTVIITVKDASPA